MEKSLLDKIPPQLLHQNGSVFYSGAEAFTGVKDLYILGLNPGGILAEHKGQTVLHHTRKIIRNKWSEFRDVSWGGRVSGTSPYQKRVLHLIGELGHNPQLVPASNVVFLRTRSQKQLKGDFYSLADSCWPFHSDVISQLEIKNILCFGSLGGHYVKNKLNANTLIDQFTENNNRKWKSSVYRNSNGKQVIIVPHPSRADYTNPAADPSSFIRKYMRS